MAAATSKPSHRKVIFFMRSTHYIRCAAIGLAALSILTPALASRLNGEWMRDDGLIRARIARCGGQICAINTRAKNPNGEEKIGDRFIMLVRAAAPGHWTGSAFDPKRKLHYTVDLQLDGDRLMTSGCPADSTFCKSAEWRRAGSTAGGSSANRGEYDASAH